MKFFEQLFHGSSKDWMHPFGSKITERNEHEGPFMELRVRYDESGLMDHLIPVEKDIEIQRPCFVKLISLTICLSFNLLKFFKKNWCRKLCVKTPNSIQKGTAFSLHRLRFIDRRIFGDCDAAREKFLLSEFEITRTVPKIGPDPDKDFGHNGKACLKAWNDADGFS